MKNYNEFINEELGETLLPPYSYQMVNYEDGDLVVMYKFETDDGDLYTVRFLDLYEFKKSLRFPEKYKNTYQVEFVTTDKDGDNVVLNKGRFFKVISTVIDIIRDFIKFKDPRVLKIHPSKNFKKDKRRKNIYIRYIEKLLPDDYKYKKTLFGDSIIISKKD